MLSHFIKLSCTNCGGELEIYEDMERFACGHCCTQMEVQRRGGTVALRLVAADSGNDQAGTLSRLKQEVENLSKQEKALLQAGNDRKKWGYGIGAGLMLLGFFLVRSSHAFLSGMAVMFSGMFAISFLRRYDKKVMSDVRDLQAKIDITNGRIEDRCGRSQ